MSNQPPNRTYLEALTANAQAKASPRLRPSVPEPEPGPGLSRPGDGQIALSVLLLLLAVITGAVWLFSSGTNHEASYRYPGTGLTQTVKVDCRAGRAADTEDARRNVVDFEQNAACADGWDKRRGLNTGARNVALVAGGLGAILMTTGTIASRRARSTSAPKS